MLMRYRVGIIPNLTKMKVYIYDIDEGDLIEDEGNIFDMFQFINEIVDDDDCTILIQDIDMMSAKFDAWKSFSKSFNKRHKYKQWEKRRGKFIPDEYTEGDMKSDYFTGLVGYGSKKEMQIVTKLIAEAYKRKEVDVYSYIYTDILKKVQQPKTKQPDSYHKADMIILNQEKRLTE